MLISPDEDFRADVFTDLCMRTTDEAAERILSPITLSRQQNKQLSRFPDYRGRGVGLGLVLSSTFSAPCSVCLAPLFTVFLVPFLILCPVFFAAFLVECAASLVSCLIPPSS